MTPTVRTGRYVRVPFYGPAHQPPVRRPDHSGDLYKEDSRVMRRTTSWAVLQDIPELGLHAGELVTVADAHVAQHCDRPDLSTADIAALLEAGVVERVDITPRSQPVVSPPRVVALLPWRARRLQPEQPPR